jgi:hypothetical protein
LSCWRFVLMLVMYRFDILSLIVRGVHRLRVFEKRVLRIFVLKKIKLQGVPVKYMVRSFINCIHRQVWLEWYSQGGRGWQRMQHKLGRKECIEDIVRKARKKVATRKTKT